MTENFITMYHFITKAQTQALSLPEHGVFFHVRTNILYEIDKTLDEIQYAVDEMEWNSLERLVRHNKPSMVTFSLTESYLTQALEAMQNEAKVSTFNYNLPMQYLKEAISDAVYGGNQ